MRLSELRKLLSANAKRRGDAAAAARLGFDMLLEDRTVINDLFTQLAPVGVGVAALAATALMPTHADDGGAVASTNPAAEIRWVDGREGGCLPWLSGDPFLALPPTREV